MTISKAAAELNSIIRGNVERKMSASGKSQADMARHLGVSRAAVSFIMSGDRNFSLNHIVLLAELFDCSEWILLLPPDPKKKSKK